MGLFIWKYSVAPLSPHVYRKGVKSKKEGDTDNKCKRLMNLCFVPFSSHISTGHVAQLRDIPNVIGMYKRKENNLI